MGPTFDSPKVYDDRKYEPCIAGSCFSITKSSEERCYGNEEQAVSTISQSLFNKLRDNKIINIMSTRIVSTIDTPVRRSTRETSSHVKRNEISPLKFERVTLNDIPKISKYLSCSTSHTCDYTVGGIYMWVHYFNYCYSIYRDTLFISGVSEEDMSEPAFSMPLGALPLRESVDLLRKYCRDNGWRLRFSAIPADCVEEFKAVGDWKIEPLTDWSDYLYDAEPLSTLSGKKYSKKRNHVNRFLQDNPEATLRPMTPALVPEVLEAFYKWDDGDALQSLTELEERDMTVNVLQHLDKLTGFEGAYLDDGKGNIVAFTVGEVIGDTLYDHIEKMDHEVSGAGVAVFHLFVKEMIKKYPELRYVNREEDVGDPGLRQAKLSYHPSAVLEKFDLIEI